MDLVSKSHSIHVSETLLSPITSPQANSLFRTTTNSLHSNDTTSFPVIAIAIIGILATAFLLVSYYVFVIKCCLNWHRTDLLRRFSHSANRPLMAYSPGLEPPRSSGLDESVIRSIPVFQFQKNNLSTTATDDVKSSECAVCLNEFQDDEKLRIIPNCLHIFHIDCIDVWLQNNANCPLCRTSISANRFQFNPVIAPSSTPVDPGPYNDEDYVVIELSNEPNNGHTDRIIGCQQGEVVGAPPTPPSRKIENSSKKYRSKFKSKGTSMGDECIDSRREKDEEFWVQPIRRSFSMDSSADRKMFLAIQETVRHGRQVSSASIEVNLSVSPVIECSRNSSNNINRVKRPFFSFGHGRGGSSRSAVLSVYLEP